LLLGTISNIANDSGVTIISLKPATEEVFPLYVKYSFNLVVGVNSYHTIGKFVSNLEKHPDLYFVNQLSFRTTEDSPEQGKENKIIVVLTISTILFKG
jgi:Tfp pilus assembly protein PilO